MDVGRNCRAMTNGSTIRLANILLRLLCRPGLPRLSCSCKGWNFECVTLLSPSLGAIVLEDAPGVADADVGSVDEVGKQAEVAHDPEAVDDESSESQSIHCSVSKKT